MAWDPEKYRDKREKVLGKRKQGFSFGTICAMVAGLILIGTAGISLPDAISYLQTRNLEDAIFRLENDQAWPMDLVAEVEKLHGVAQASLDTHAMRLVITFDRRQARPENFSTLFKGRDLAASLLNQVSHRQRLATMKEEAHH